MMLFDNYIRVYVIYCWIHTILPHHNLWVIEPGKHRLIIMLRIIRQLDCSKEASRPYFDFFLSLWVFNYRGGIMLLYFSHFILWDRESNIVRTRLLRLLILLCIRIEGWRSYSRCIPVMPDIRWLHILRQASGYRCR